MSSAILRCCDSNRTAGCEQESAMLSIECFCRSWGIFLTVARNFWVGLVQEGEASSFHVEAMLKSVLEIFRTASRSSINASMITRFGSENLLDSSGAYSTREGACSSSVNNGTFKYGNKSHTWKLGLSTRPSYQDSPSVLRSDIDREKQPAVSSSLCNVRKLIHELFWESTIIPINGEYALQVGNTMCWANTEHSVVCRGTNHTRCARWGSFQVKNVLYRKALAAEWMFDTWWIEI